MNPEIKSKLLEIITSAQATATDAYTLVKTQAPELAREVVLARGIDVGVGITFYTACGVISIISARQAFKHMADKSFESDGKAFFTGFLAFMFGIAFVPLGLNVVAFLQCIFTPRVVFLQEVAKLLK